MKNKIVLGSFTALATFVLAACGNSTKTVQKTTTQSTTEVVTETATKTTAQADTNSTSTSHTLSDIGEIQRVGSSEYGYVDIPKSWVPFKDPRGGNVIQYSDGTNINIITLTSIPRERANLKDGDTYNAELIANRIYYSWKKNENIEKLWGSKSWVSGNESYQVNLITKSGKILVTWIFQKDDTVYKVSLEGDRETLLLLIPYVESTWGLTDQSPVSR
jgi:hypothetical protein